MTAMSICRFPDVLSVEKKDMDSEAITAGIIAIVEEALNDFDSMRLRGGEKAQGRRTFQAGDHRLPGDCGGAGEPQDSWPITEPGLSAKWLRCWAAPG